MPGHPEHLLLDAVQQVVREDDLTAVNSRAAQEAQRRGAARAEHLPAEGDHLSPVHVVLDGQLLHLIKEVRGAFLAAPGHLQADLARAMVAGSTQQHRQPRAGVVNQVQAASHAGAGPPRRARRDRGERDAADPEVRDTGVQPARLGQVTEPERRMAESRDPGQLVLSARGSQPGIQADLDVHVIIGRPRPGHHWQAGPPGAKVIEQQPRQLVLGPRCHHRPAQQPPPQPEHVGEFLPGRHSSRSRACARRPGRFPVAHGSSLRKQGQAS